MKQGQKNETGSDTLFGRRMRRMKQGQTLFLEGRKRKNETGSDTNGTAVCKIMI
jgi:hypothetical protein